MAGTTVRLAQSGVFAFFIPDGFPKGEGVTVKRSNVWTGH